jgi:hypothetical protein
MYDKSASADSDAYRRGYRLDATTAAAARKEALRLSHEHNIHLADIGITFFRSEDHCRGEIE